MPSADKLGVAVDGTQLPVEDPIQIHLDKYRMISANIGEETMDCLIDTGATCNLVSESYKENPVFKRLRLTTPKFDHTTTVNGSRIATECSTPHFRFSIYCFFLCSEWIT